MQQKGSYLKKFLKRVVWRTSQSLLGNSSVKCIRKKHVWLALTAKELRTVMTVHF